MNTLAYMFSEIWFLVKKKRSFFSQKVILFLICSLNLMFYAMDFMSSVTEQKNDYKASAFLQML